MKKDGQSQEEHNEGYLMEGGRNYGHILNWLARYWAMASRRINRRN